MVSDSSKAPELADDEFSDPFWKDARFEIDQAPAAKIVAQMSQSNSHVPHDPEKFLQTAARLIGPFLAALKPKV